MKDKKEKVEKKEKKNRPRDFKMIIFRRILASIIAILLLGAAFYTPIALLIQNKS